MEKPSRRNRIFWFVAVIATIFGIESGNLVAELKSRSLSHLGGSLYASQDISTISQQDYYSQVVDLLERTYVEPVTDEQKLSSGAVKGMIQSLDDPLADFMNKEQFATFQRTLAGEFSGIGVELRFVYDEEALAKAKKLMAEAEKESDTESKSTESFDSAKLVPKLVVSAVVPGSPAANAGLLSGDRIDAVNGKWVLSAERIKQFRDESKKVRESKVNDIEMDRQLRNLDTRYRNGTTPARVRDLLTLGTSGTVSVEWVHGTQHRQANIEKKRTLWPALVHANDGSYEFHLFTGAADQLKNVIKADGTVTLDLRNSTLGDFNSLKAVLSALAPKGDWGTIQGHGGKTTRLTSDGPGAQSKLRLIVDPTTRGAAEILALALRQGKLAEVSGTTSGEKAMLRVTSLPDGAGFTLPVGKLVNPEAKS